MAVYTSLRVFADILDIHSVLPPLSNSWIITIIWLYIALNRSPNIDCYWEGAVPKTYRKTGFRDAEAWGFLWVDPIRRITVWLLLCY